MTVYAVDISILISSNCYEELKRNFDEVLYNTLKWFQANKLVLNREKTKMVKFTPANFSYSPSQITFTEDLPAERNDIKFLGLQMDSQLSWKLHTNYLLHKLSTLCFIIRLSHILNIQTMRTVHFAHYHSLVKYGIIFGVIWVLCVRYS